MNVPDTVPPNLGADRIAFITNAITDHIRSAVELWLDHGTAEENEEDPQSLAAYLRDVVNEVVPDTLADWHRHLESQAPPLI
jgi:hypothetical protein